MGKTIIMACAAIAYSVLCTGCSSIICGAEKTINIKSTPESRFTIEDSKGKIIAQGYTPTNVTLKRGSGFFKASDYKIKLEKYGYQTSLAPVKQGVEIGWYGLGNVLVGGLIGWVIVDPLTGAMWNIEDVNTTLVPKGRVFNYQDRPFELLQPEQRRSLTTVN